MQTALLAGQNLSRYSSFLFRIIIPQKCRLPSARQALFLPLASAGRIGPSATKTVRHKSSPVQNQRILIGLLLKMRKHNTLIDHQDGRDEVEVALD